MNSKEIAKIAGVSRSTVSKVLNNYPHISEKTRKKVLEVINEKNYIPDSNAQALAGKSNNVIGIFIYEKNYEENIKDNHGINFVYFTDFIDTCMKEAFLYGHQVLVDVIEDKKGEARIESFFERRSISGGIFIGLNKESEIVEKLMKKNYKIALIDYKENLEKNNGQTFLINIKDFEAAQIITNKLIALGNKKILYISGDEKKLTAIERKRGYLKALEEQNIEIDKNLIISSNFQRDDSLKKIIKFLKKGIEFDAVFSANDTMAYSFLDAIKILNLNEKYKNISIWGYDNLRYSFIQGIKTVSPNFNEAAIEAIKSLIIEGYGKKEATYIGVKFIETLEDYLNT